MDAFDADVLIYAAAPDHPLGRRVRPLFVAGEPDERPASDDATSDNRPPVGVGSILLLPELLSKPQRLGASHELSALAWLLAHLELHPVDAATARLATALGASLSLRAVDAVHLATAIGVGADRFLTNNRRDFPRSIAEIDVTYPDDLPGP